MAAYTHGVTSYFSSGVSFFLAFFFYFMQLLNFALFAVPALAAPLFQTQVEMLRVGGMSEREILAHLNANHPTPAYTGAPVYTESRTSTVYRSSLDRDTEGDISPGSSPEFHFAVSGFMRRIVKADNLFASDTDEPDIPKTSDHPAWIFQWMGGLWRSAASKKPRAKWIR